MGASDHSLGTLAAVVAAMQGACPWVWIVNLDHVTYVRDGLSIGDQPIHGHGHGLPLIQNLSDWAWTEG